MEFLATRPSSYIRKGLLCKLTDLTLLCNAVHLHQPFRELLFFANLIVFWVAYSHSSLVRGLQSGPLRCGIGLGLGFSYFGTLSIICNLYFRIVRMSDLVGRFYLLVSNLQILELHSDFVVKFGACKF